jgi:hypothetical protein
VFAVVAYATNPEALEQVWLRVEVFVLSDFFDSLNDPFLSFVVCFLIKRFGDECTGSETVDAQSLRQLAVFLFDSDTVDV